MKSGYNLVLGLLGAVFFHAILFWGIVIVRPGDTKPVVENSDRMEVEVLSEVSEQMALFDPRPMLLPTKWNAANARDISDLVDAEFPIFEDYEYRFAKEEGGFVSAYGNSWDSNSELRDVHLAFDFPQVDQIGSGELRSFESRDELLTLRLRDPRTGELLIEEKIDDGQIDEMRSKWPGWSPVTYFVTVVDTFFLQGSTVLESSGYQDLDIFLERLTKEILRNKGIWADGTYLLEVGL